MVETETPAIFLTPPTPANTKKSNQAYAKHFSRITSFCNFGERQSPATLT